MKTETKNIVIFSSVITSLIVAYIVFKYFQRKAARKVLDKKVGVQANLDLVDAFNPNRWKTGKPKISDAKARTIAKQIKDSIGWFTEDEDKINKAFYGIQHYDDLSLVSYQYGMQYQKNLYNALKIAFHKDDVKMARLRSIIANRIQMK
jgi:hypothetical protein